MALKTALVSGANKGIGFEICRQLARKKFHVILTSRDFIKGNEACEKLKKEGLNIQYVQLDVSSSESIQKLIAWMKSNLPTGLDVLVNNAAVFLLTDRDQNSSVLSLDGNILVETLQTNLIGPLLLSQALAPFLIQKKGRVINLSSGLGQLSEMDGGMPAYRFSKTAINALTRMLASELKDKQVAVNSMCPGWVRTDMGGPSATRSTEQGADTAVWLASEADASMTGGFYRDRKSISW